MISLAADIVLDDIILKCPLSVLEEPKIDSTSDKIQIGSIIGQVKC